MGQGKGEASSNRFAKNSKFLQEPSKGISSGIISLDRIQIQELFPLPNLQDCNLSPDMQKYSRVKIERNLPAKRKIKRRESRRPKKYNLTWRQEIGEESCVEWIQSKESRICEEVDMIKASRGFGRPGFVLFLRTCTEKGYCPSPTFDIFPTHFSNKFRNQILNVESSPC